MRLFLHILSYKIRAVFNATFDLQAVPIIRGLGSLVVFGAFAYGAFAFGHNVTAYVLGETRTGLYLYHRFISMMLFVFFMAVNMGNIIVSYSTLYRSAEVSFFMTKPIPHATVFFHKFLDNFFYSSTTLFLVAFAVILGYGTYFGHPWYFYGGTLVFVIIPFMFLAALIAVIVLMGIMRLAGRFGFRTVMGGLFTVYFGFIVLFFRSSNPVRLIERVNRFYPNVDGYLSQLDPGFLSYLPSHWVAEYLFFMARGEVSRAFASAGLLLSATLALFGLVMIVAVRYYYRSWLVSLAIQASGAAPYDPSKLAFIDLRASGWLRGKLEALLKKEYLTFVREPSQMIHLVVMVVLTGLFVLSVGNLNLRVRVTEIQLVTYLVLYAFGGFLVSSVALRFVFPSISLEGRAFWVLRSAPVRPEYLVALKFVLGFIVVFGLSLVVSLASNLPFARFSGRISILPWFGAFSAFWMSAAVVALNLGLGGFFALYTERNPIRIASTQGATLTFLATIVFLFALVVIILYPLSRYFEFLFIFRPFERSLVVLPGTIFGMLSAAVVGVSAAVAVYSVRRDL